MAKTVLNVGAGNEGTKIPPWYDGWQVVRLDIDPKVRPDILLDAREVRNVSSDPFDYLPFDAVFCSHNLEHYTPHDAGVVLKGMRQVLKPGGFVDIFVPNVGLILREAAGNGWDLDTFLYQSPGGPICVRDMLYGYERQIDFADHPEYMVHKNAFSGRTLSLLLKRCGFGPVFVGEIGWELRGVGFLEEPGDERLAEVGVAVKEREIEADVAL